jgi:murein L,D-transpeptidase YafK
MRALAKFFALIVFLLLASLQTGCVSHQSEPWQGALNTTVGYYAPAAETRLKPYFQRANINYPPAQIALLIFKQEKRLELWVGNQNAKWTFIKAYPILAASGGAGPKLREGDDQVPEGIYKIIALNPHSRFHLSLDLNYPNEFDRQHARLEHRLHPGSNIFIHGSNVSIGCVAIGNAAIEELFVLIYRTGLAHTEVIIAPNDLRVAAPARGNKKPPRWVPVLYQHIAEALELFDSKNNYA